jgi:hypothetical protein
VGGGRSSCRYKANDMCNVCLVQFSLDDRLEGPIEALLGQDGDAG